MDYVFVSFSARVSQTGRPLGVSREYPVRGDGGWAGQLLVSLEAPPGGFSLGASCVLDDQVLPPVETDFRVLPGDPVAIGARPAVVRANSWHLRNTLTTGAGEHTFVYGDPGDWQLSGDWDGDGSRSPGVFRNGVFYLRNSNTTGIGEIVFAYGDPTDTPVVGDWDADGVETVAVVRDRTGFRQWFPRNSNDAGDPNWSFFFGDPQDGLATGDWDGDGRDTPLVVRGDTWYLSIANFSDVAVDRAFRYGDRGDQPVVGDWDADGIDTPGVVRGFAWHVRNSNTGGVGDMSFGYGDPGDRPLDWR